MSTADHEGAAASDLDSRTSAEGSSVVMRAAPSHRAGRLRPAAWLAAVLVAQTAIVIARDAALVVGSVPIGAAQGNLLQDIYGLSFRWDTLGWLGFWRGLQASGGHPTVATVLASLVEVYGGGGRLALLLPGFALLLACEVAFAAAALRLTRSPGLAALGLGILLLRTRPWLAGTGLFTVNTDWLAFCSFGAAASLMIAPPARHRLPRALVCVALGAVTLCVSRTTFACLLAVAALRLATGRGHTPARIAAALALAAAAIAQLWTADTCPATPFTGIRLDGDMVARCGYGLRTSLLYLATFDFGLASVAAAVLSLGAVLVVPTLCRDRATAPRMPWRSRADAAFLMAILVALACIQVARRSADPIGSGLADVPVTALLLAALESLGRRLAGPPRRSARAACFGLLALCSVLPSVYPLLDTPLQDDGQRRAASEAASWLVHDAEANERPRARILTASVPSLIDGPSLSAFFYETFGEPAAFTVTDQAADGDDLGALDYAILPARALASPIGSALQRRLDAAMIRRARLDPQGLDLVVYSAPAIAVSGISGDWLLATGTSLRFSAGEVPPGRVIALRGPDAYARYLPDPPTITAAATTPTGTSLSLPARFVRTGDTYTILVDPGALAAAGGGRADVALAFDRFFVPKEVGLNQDPRHLAVMAPTAVGLAPRAAFHAPPGEP